jgi:hypothetical protein
MKIGVIAEGHSDRAVIANILMGITGLDESQIQALRPIYAKDATDKALTNPLTYSNWSLVKEECEKRRLIDGFLAIEGQDFVVIHLDTAEGALFGVQKPARATQNYGAVVRQLTVDKINEWLKGELKEEVLYAVAVEEIDAWILTIYDAKANSSVILNPKEKLNRVLGKAGIKSTAGYDNYLLISNPLSKTKEIAKGKFLERNESLEAFYQEILDKVLPKLISNNLV